MNLLVMDTLSVSAHLTVAQAVARAMDYFGSEDKRYDANRAMQGSPVLPCYVLRYRGHDIPVSADDTSSALTARVKVYVDENVDVLPAG